MRLEGGALLNKTSSRFRTKDIGTANAACRYVLMSGSVLLALLTEKLASKSANVWQFSRVYFDI